MSFIYCHLNFHANLLRPWRFPLSSVKRRNILCSGEHGKQKIKCIVFYSHECLCEILHLISTVVCQMSTLYCGGGSRNISCMPRCRFNVLNVQLQKYIYYWSPEIFKSPFALIYFFGFETYRLIGRQLIGRQKLVASLSLVKFEGKDFLNTCLHACTWSYRENKQKYMSRNG